MKTLEFRISFIISFKSQYIIESMKEAGLKNVSRYPDEQDMVIQFDVPEDISDEDLLKIGALIGQSIVASRTQ